MGQAGELIGRGRETDRLSAWLLDDLTGGAAVVEGEPGIGKSALLSVLVERARDRGFVVGQCAGEELGAERPLGTILHALRGPTSELSPTFDAWWSNSSGNDPSAILGAGLVPASVIDALVDQLEALGGGRRVLVALDDLQWADSDTVLSLPPLIRRASTLGVSFLLALRPTPGRPGLARTLEALDRIGTARLALGPLADADVRTLVRRRARGHPVDDLIEWAARAGGNPFYVIELVDTLTDRPDDGSATQPVGQDAGSLPASLRRRLVQRVEAEGDELASMLQLAAMLGRVVHIDELMAVLNRSAVDLQPLISAALRCGWWTAVDDTLSFRHDLIREALLEATPVAVRRALHREVASVLERTGAPSERVCHHLVQGLEGADPAAVSSIVNRAAELPRTVAAELLAEVRTKLKPGDPLRAEVETAYVHALVWSNNPRDGDRLSREALRWVTDDRLVYELLASRSYALFQLGDPRGAFESWEAARGRAAEVLTPFEHSQLAAAKLFAGDVTGADASATLAIEGVDIPRHGVRVARAVRAWIAGTRGDFRTALAETELALEDVGAVDQPEPDRPPHDVPHLYRAAILEGVGRSAEALELLGPGFPALDDVGSSSVAVLRHACTAVSLFRTGRWDEALVECEAGTALSHDAALRLGDGWFLGIQAMVAVHRGDPQLGATILGDQPPELYGPDLGLDWLAHARALVDEAGGDPSLALATLSLALDMAAALGVRSSAEYLGIDAVRLARAAGDDERLRAAVGAIDDLAARSTMAPHRAASLQAHGMVSDDGAMLLDAAGLLEAIPRPWEAARARHHAAVAFARADHPERARAEAYRAIGTFERLGAVGSVARLRADLRSTGIRLRVARGGTKPSSGWSSLTPTETQVAGLVGQGLSNAEIATRLFVSRRTVESHLSQIYRKVGLRSRLQLARTAGEVLDTADRQTSP